MLFNFLGANKQLSFELLHFWSQAYVSFLNVHVLVRSVLQAPCYLDKYQVLLALSPQLHLLFNVKNVTLFVRLWSSYSLVTGHNIQGGGRKSKKKVCFASSKELNFFLQICSIKMCKIIWHLLIFEPVNKK